MFEPRLSRSRNILVSSCNVLRCVPPPRVGVLFSVFAISCIMVFQYGRVIGVRTGCILYIYS
jgi:hypothetical protein